MSEPVMLPIFTAKKNKGERSEKKEKGIKYNLGNRTREPEFQVVFSDPRGWQVLPPIKGRSRTEARQLEATNNTALQYGFH